MSADCGAAIFQAVNASRSSLKRFMWWAHLDLAKTQEEANALYNSFYEKTIKGEEANFALIDPKNNACMGCASLVSGSRLNPAALEVGYWIATPYQGRGLATQATRILIVQAFHYYETDRLCVTSNPENGASLRVIEKCGFKREGLLRNMLPAPTPEMVADGYSKVQDVLSFSLTPQDLGELAWYEPLLLELYPARN